METVLLIATISALIGAYLTSKAKWQGFLIWIFTNIIFSCHNYSIKEYPQAFLFAMYLLISVSGLINFRKNKSQQEINLADK